MRDDEHGDDGESDRSDAGTDDVIVVRHGCSRASMAKCAPAPRADDERRHDDGSEPRQRHMPSEGHAEFVTTREDQQVGEIRADQQQ